MARLLARHGGDTLDAVASANARNDLLPGGSAVFIGAGGPMGQMHVQRALELPDGPKFVIATDISDDRLQTLKDMFIPLAEHNKREIHFFNPNESKVSLLDFLKQVSGGRLADDVVVSVPVAGLMEEASTRGTLWFWSSVLETAGSHLWRDLSVSPLWTVELACWGFLLYWCLLLFAAPVFNVSIKILEVASQVLGLAAFLETGF